MPHPPLDRDLGRALRSICLCGLLIGGCVRAGFDGAAADAARPDASPLDAAARDGDARPLDAPGPDVDAQLIDGGGAGWTLDPQSIVKGSVKAPLLAAHAPTSKSCGRYLIALPPGWMPTTFIELGAIVFSIPCKYNDSGTGGWHTAFARWDGKAATATWIDGDLSAAGNQESISKYDLVQGQELHNQGTTFLERLADGRLVGVGRRYVSGKGYVQVPIIAPSFGSLSASHWRIDLPGVFDFGANDSSFKGASELPRALLHENSVFYIYNQSRDKPKDTTSFLSVVTSTDMLGMTPPSAYLAAGYRHPYVFKHRGAYHLVAYSDVAKQWQHIPGTSPTNFALGQARDLLLERFRGSVGEWDQPLFVAFDANQPLVNGVEVLGDTLYIFYLAGDTGYPGNAPYGAPRAVGVLSVPLKAP